MTTSVMTVPWLDWSDEAFAQAAAGQKPVLLSIVATWCQWCREMDRTTYSDPAVVAAIRDRFIPIRVDAEGRPDIGDRYNLGAWPTTAFLTPGGEILGGGTYLPPDRMIAVLDQVSAAFVTRRSEIDVLAEAAVGYRQPAADERARVAGRPDDQAIEWLTNRMLAEFDETQGGFGVEPKFPHVPAVSLALELFRRHGDARLAQIVEQTLHAISSRGLRDDVEGGFFRYAMTRDWMLPHTEKLVTLNAGLITLYLDAWKTFGTEAFRDRAIDTLRYVHSTLADRGEAGYFASQTADDAYYALKSAQERRAAGAPPVDRHLYTDANALMAAAGLRASELLEDPSAGEFAIRSFERVLVASYERAGGVAHSLGEDAVRGLLTDHVQVGLALLDAYAATERAVYRDLAQELTLHALGTMWDEAEGGFFDRASSAGAPGERGLLCERLKPCALNCDAARLLIRLSVVCNEPAFRVRAEQTLASQAGAYRAHGLRAAGYGLAILELMN